MYKIAKGLKPAAVLAGMGGCTIATLLFAAVMLGGALAIFRRRDF